MFKLKKSVENYQSNVKNTTYKETDYDELKLLGLQVKPHEYQIFGINWITRSFLSAKHCGNILGDEMGLGKTLQSVASLLHLKKKFNINGPFLVLSPLSVINSWEKEFERCAPELCVLTYIGKKDQREEIQEKIASKYLTANWKNLKTEFDVLLTSYEVYLKDIFFLNKFCWKILIVDEAHRLKNHTSLLYKELSMMDIGFKLLLTGTPVQNNLQEIYSLLSFIAPTVFMLDNIDEFVSYFSLLVEDESHKRQELHELLKPFLLRRTKNEVLQNLPKKSEVILYCGISQTQKNLYKAILTKDLGAFDREGGQKTRLLNILMQLRKCCNHPYIFPGIESEPFQLGEHLVESSGKLYLLDKLLAFLKQSGHKVLLFSQMTSMLDIVQDYLGYRGYSYERLDGSVRGEERFLAVNNFNSSEDTFIFLLSTKAGGQGLNLTSADTVIFLDSDFNPQNDLQAAARSHRIGQYRPVKIIRLLSKNTVEEIILKRAEKKLKLTNVVIEGGQFSSIKSMELSEELGDILKYGLQDLMNSDDSLYEKIDFEKVLGKTYESQWFSVDETQHVKVESNEDSEVKDNIYEFEGEDYSTATEKDKAVFEELLNDVLKLQGERSSRKDTKSFVELSFVKQKKRKQKDLTNEEKEELAKKREENKAKRIKMLEEKAKEKILKLWETHKYNSCKLELPSCLDNENPSFEVESDDEEQVSHINYVVGDVTNPRQVNQRDAIIVHCVDDSGYWGHGGLFSAINKHSKQPKEQYELAFKMKDLHLGDVHLINMQKTDFAIYVALIVVFSRDRNNQISPMLLNYLSTSLEKIHHLAKETGASVHLPRIGYNSPNFNWYGTERLIKKILADQKVPTYIYYYKKFTQINSSSTDQLTPHLATESNESKFHVKDSLPDIFSGLAVYFHGLNDLTEIRRLSRFVIAYDGEVDTSLTPDTTHVVTTSCGKRSLDYIPDSVKVVETGWIDECCKQEKLVSEDLFIVK
ncbi:chromodomain-helicase-DNA-binding protein 1-like isoform X1 [Hydra vulgaris]|nr:chromodomain-helicase-DNA-binding protein 1-like isoform X1 [Hydra vulgaris]